MSDSELYDRQSRLREVGRAGQSRIEQCPARIAAGPGAAIELAYLVRAGVARGEIRAVTRAPSPHAEFFSYSGPAAVADGAQAALQHILRSLDSA